MTSYGINTYKYNSEGIRISKTTSEGDYKYLLDGNKIIKEIKPNNKEIYYHYDEKEELVGFNYNAKEYFYIRDITGNITNIIDSNGSVKVSYEYDAWGKVINIDGDEDLIEINSYLYKGYYYDKETLLYYCKYRYYDPEIRRWISMDDVNYLDSETINGVNLYAYCMNNPVMCSDPSGHMPKWLGNILKGAAIIAATALVVTAITFTGGTATAFFVAVGKAALVGLKIVAVAGATSGIIRTGRSLAKNIREGNDFSETMSNAGKSFLAGFGDGFLAGSQYYMSTSLLSFGAYSSLEYFNNGFGLIRTTYMIGYQNPNVLGITIFASRTGGRFRVDLDPTHSFHYHYGHTKAEREKHKGSWIGGIFVGIYAGFNGEVY